MSGLRREILRYLGYKYENMGQIDPVIEGHIEDAINILKESCRPRCQWKRISVTIGNDGLLGFGKLGEVMKVSSEKLSYNLRGCTEVILMAATLGIEADTLISRWSKRDISKGVVVEAAATALIEEYCDEMQKVIARELAEEGLYLRPRFSPGYGDFSILHQKDMLAFLECSKKMGLSMTDSFMLVPAKSVTAVIGITSAKDGCSIKGCEACEKKDCEYRRNS